MKKNNSKTEIDINFDLSSLEMLDEQFKDKGEENLTIENNNVNSLSSKSKEDLLDLEEVKFNLEFSKFQEFSLSIPGSLGLEVATDGFEIFEQERIDKLNKKNQTNNKQDGEMFIATIETLDDDDEEEKKGEDDEEEGDDDEYNAFLREEKEAKMRLSSIPVIGTDEEEHQKKKSAPINISKIQVEDEEEDEDEIIDKVVYKPSNQMQLNNGGKKDNTLDLRDSDLIDDEKKINEIIKSTSPTQRTSPLLPQKDSSFVAPDRSCSFDDDKPWIHELSFDPPEELPLTYTLPELKPSVWDVNKVGNFFF